MKHRPIIACIFLLLGLMVAGRAAAPIPVLFDTDIGTDIDDVYALAQILHSPELKLLGVTTVSGDAVARARLAAKLLATAGWTDVPVYAGTGTPPQNNQGHCVWAAGFTAPADDGYRRLVLSSLAVLKNPAGQREIP